MTRNLWKSSPAFAIVIVFLAALPLRAAPDTHKSTLFEEKFNTKLSDGWSWIRELPTAWKVGNGELILIVQPNYLHPFGKESRNLLLRSLPADIGANWAVDVKLESDPRIQYEHAGVLMFWDEDNFIALFRESLDGKPKMQMVIVKNNSPHFAVVAQDLKPVWLRLAVNGDDVTAQFRAAEKDPWQTAGKSKRVSPNPPRCGLTSGGAPKDAHRDATFSHFQIVRLP